MFALEVPMLPVPEESVTVVPVNVPVDSIICPEPSAVRKMLPAVVLPPIVIDPLLPVAVFRLKELPAEDAPRATLLLAVRKTLEDAPAALALTVEALTTTLLAEVPILPPLELRLTTDAVSGTEAVMFPVLASWKGDLFVAAEIFRLPVLLR